MQPTYKIAENRWAVVGFDSERGQKIMASIESECGKEVSRRIRNKNEMVTKFSDGTVLTWVQAAGAFCGQRFGKMWCDINIDDNVWKYIVRPCYFGKLEDIVWI